MGFRHTLVSEYYSPNLPKWFKEKYKGDIIVLAGTLIVSCREFKIYSNEIFDDFQKALIESGIFKNVSQSFSVTVAVLAEDDFVSKVEIKEKSIKYLWPTGFSEETHVWYG